MRAGARHAWLPCYYTCSVPCLHVLLQVQGHNHTGKCQHRKDVTFSNRMPIGTNHQDGTASQEGTQAASQGVGRREEGEEGDKRGEKEREKGRGVSAWAAGYKKAEESLTMKDIQNTGVKCTGWGRRVGHSHPPSHLLPCLTHTSPP